MLYRQFSLDKSHQVKISASIKKRVQLCYILNLVMRDLPCSCVHPFPKGVQHLRVRVYIFILPIVVLVTNCCAS